MFDFHIYVDAGIDTLCPASPNCAISIKVIGMPPCINIGVNDVQNFGADGGNGGCSRISTSSIKELGVLKTSLVGIIIHSSNEANEVISLRPSKAGGDGVIVNGGVPKKAIRAASSNTCARVDVGVLLGVRGNVSPHGYDVSTLRQSKRSASVNGVIVTDGVGDGGEDGIVAGSMIMYVSWSSIIGVCGRKGGADV